MFSDSDLSWVKVLAKRYDTERRREKLVAKAVIQARGPSGDEGDLRRALATHRSAAERLMLARRALADGVTRILVRRHKKACVCRTCAAERAALEPARAPRRKAARR